MRLFLLHAETIDKLQTSYTLVLASSFDSLIRNYCCCSPVRK